jgi:hypothetical protein
MNELTEQIRAYFSAMGKKGGSVKGVSKARTREQAQRAVNARWERYRTARAGEALKRAESADSASSASSASADKINLEKSP